MALLAVGFAAVLVALLATRCGNVAEQPPAGTVREGGTTSLRVELTPGGEQTLEIGTGDLIVR